MVHGCTFLVDILIIIMYNKTEAGVMSEEALFIIVSELTHFLYKLQYFPIRNIIIYSNNNVYMYH